MLLLTGKSHSLGQTPDASGILQTPLQSLKAAYNCQSWCTAILCCPPQCCECQHASVQSEQRQMYNVNNVKCTAVCCAARLFVQLVDLFQFYMMFPIDDHTGDPVSDEDVTAAHYEKVQQVT